MFQITVSVEGPVGSNDCRLQEGSVEGHGVVQWKVNAGFRSPYGTTEGRCMVQVIVWFSGESQ
jgi:hypothetical protein